VTEPTAERVRRRRDAAWSNGPDRGTARALRVPMCVPNSVILSASQPVRVVGDRPRRADITRSSGTRNEGVRGSSPRVGSGYSVDGLPGSGVSGQSTAGWHGGEHDPQPWTDCFPGILIAAYKEFESRTRAGAGRGSKKALITTFIDSLMVPEFTIADVRQAAPGVSDGAPRAPRPAGGHRPRTPHRPR
jgi:hypothetical protein